MKHLLSRFGMLLIVACAGGLAISFLHPVAHGQEAVAPAPAAQPQAVAEVEQLKSEAFKEIRGGNFDKSSDLLTQAATLSQDPQIIKMAAWTRQFEVQRESFAAERHKQYDKAVTEVHLLLDHHMNSYAIDEVARACLLADNKDDFRKEQWVDDLVKESATAADHYEDSEQWLKALRMYSDLESLEPANPEWKDKLKLATRRIRLLMVYAPDGLKKLQDAEAKDRKAADDLLRAATQPSADAGGATTQPSIAAAMQKLPGAGVDQFIQATTQPSIAATTQPAEVVANAATQPTTAQSEATNDAFRVDWREVTKGTEYKMLTEALVDAEKDYYRQVSFQNLLQGGLMGIKTLVTTNGLEDTFPGLKDQAKRTTFLDAVDSCIADAKAATADTGQAVLDNSLNRLRDLNDKTIQLPEEVFVSEFADGALSELDPFSSMIWPYDIEEFTKTTQGEFGGVGIQIQSDKDGNLKVVSPLPDTPAYRAGIKAGDVISQINGKNAHGISLDRAVKAITGVPGTEVTLTIRKVDNSVKDLVVKREIIKVESVKGYASKPGGGWDYFVDPEQKIAYIRLTNFTKTSSDDMDKALDEMKDQGAKAVVLDLRYNPGGLLQSATEIVNKFIREGVIVSTHADRETQNPPTQANAFPGNEKSDLPMVVLVNQYSASASEIVSGALKDHHRALIVGERTFGKGSVQMLFPLDSKKAYLKLTTSHYYLPNGRCIHREENSTTWGVDPDVTVEMTPEQMSTAIDARQELDVLRDADSPSATTKPSKDLLSSDPQLSAALLVLRLELSGAQL